MEVAGVSSSCCRASSHRSRACAWHFGQLAIGRSYRRYPLRGRTETHVDVSAESGGTATQDGPECLQLLIAEAGLIAFQELVALRTEDVGHLHGGPAHGFSGRRKARRLSSTFDRRRSSSGLCTCCRCSLRKMEILRSSLEISMSEQNLDGAQIGSGFEQMRCPAVPQRVRRNALANTGLLCGFATGEPHRLVGDRLMRFLRVTRGKQILQWLAPAPVGPQCLEQCLAQRQIAVLTALAFDYADDHALAVDVFELQVRNFAAAHAGAVENHQQRAPEQVGAGIDQPFDFLLAQNARQSLMPSRIGQELAELLTSSACARTGSAAQQRG